MRRILLLVAAFASFQISEAQVGINNTDPKAQLDISAGTTPSEMDGLLIPRLDEYPTGVGLDQDGMMIFITGVGTPIKGFYYWDHNNTIWKPFTGGAKEIDELSDGKTGGNSVFLGIDAGSSDDSSDNRNVGVGIETLASNTVGENNIAIGYNALNSNIDGGQNTAVGLSALQANTGGMSGPISTGANNTAIGYQSMLSNTTGYNNTAVGNGSLRSNTTSAFNTAVGLQSLFFNNGASNTASGYRALYTNSSGTRNAAFGLEALNLNATGNDNTAIGYRAGRSSLGSGNVYIGSEAGTGSTGDNKFFIENTDADEDNALVYGEFGTDNTTTGNILRTNGELQIGNPTGTGYAFPAVDGAANQVLQTNGSGYINWVNAPAAESTTANNGLTLNTGNVRLGGALTQNTVITQATRNLDINLNSSGDFAIQENGTDVFFVEDSGDIGIGTNNPAHPLHIVESTASELEGIYVDKNDNSSSETNGIYVVKSGSGTGRSHAIRTRNDGTGAGQKYGVFNTISATSAGTQYGTRNFMSGATSAWQFATFNNLDNSGTGNRYGVYNGMRNASAANLYGVYNEFERAYNSADDIVGVRNRFTNGTPGTNGMNGMWTDFTTSANGNYYGSRTEYQTAATGSGNKYGSYNFISSSAGGTHYGTYNNVNPGNGWSGYFLGKNYISQRLSIGEIDNPDGRIAILNNSGGTNPAHIQLTETNANDGPRIQFANAVETTNEWTLFGRADNDIPNSSFNFFHTTTGNIMEIKGDGDVEITGQLGVNFDNPSYAIHLPNNSSVFTGRGRAFAWDTYSDGRVKSEQTNINYGLDQILKIQPKSYFHHNSKFSNNILTVSNEGEKTVGFIAQELFKIIPEAVQKPENENQSLWSVDYNKVIPVAVKAIQELKAEKDALETKVLLLETKLSQYESLEARLTALENSTNTFGNVNDITISEEN